MNKSFNYEDNLENGLQHVGSHADLDNERVFGYIGCIIAKNENSIFFLRRLRSFAQANSMISWFRDHDLAAHKQWAYVAAKLNRMVIQHAPWEWFPAYEHLYALLSDNEDMVSWYRQHDVSYFVESQVKDRDNPRQAAFHGYQAILALNGKWDDLRNRCEQILSMDIKKDKKYLIDHRFYLALANGDQVGMEAILTELTSDKVARIRNFEQAFAFTENFISTHATIYAKIAWRHGYKIEIDTPWIPKAWLPVQSLDKYEDPWDFMKTFDLFTPFDGDWVDWSPKKR